MKIRLASHIERDSIVDGEGIRSVVWTQGCPHKCPGCHNPETHDKTKGFVVDVEDLKKELSSFEIQDGITLSGGEPLCQIEAVLEIAKYAKEIGLNVWCFTGFTYEQVLKMGEINPKYLELLKNIDILVDGRFEQSLKDLSLKFRGSSNQRVINVKRSLKTDKVVISRKHNVKTKSETAYEHPKYIFC